MLVQYSIDLLAYPSGRPFGRNPLFDYVEYYRTNQLSGGYRALNPMLPRMCVLTGYHLNSQGGSLFHECEHCMLIMCSHLGEESA